MCTLLGPVSSWVFFPNKFLPTSNRSDVRISVEIEEITLTLIILLGFGRGWGLVPLWSGIHVGILSPFVIDGSINVCCCLLEIHKPCHPTVLKQFTFLIVYVILLFQHDTASDYCSFSELVTLNLPGTDYQSANSPDLNIIQHLWSNLDRQIWLCPTYQTLVN